MPIRPDLKHLYGPTWRKEIRPRILEREQHRCKNCRKPNHATVHQIVLPGRAMWWFELVRTPGADPTLQLRTHRGEILPTLALELPLIPGYDVRCVLTIAHLDHNPENMDDDNLAALCQWCHLHHDQQQHADSRATRKDSARPILASLENIAC